MSFLGFFIRFIIFGCFLFVILFGLLTSLTPQYAESDFKNNLKQSLPKIEQFSDDFLIDSNIIDYNGSHFSLHRLQEKSYEKKYFPQEKKQILKKNYDIVLFIPGHKGSFSQIIQFQGYLYKKFKDFNLTEFFFKFYSIDFDHAPSAFSENLIEKQAEYIELCLKYLTNQCISKEQKVTIVAHSMGGIAALLALTNLLEKEEFYVLKKLEKNIFLNSPLGSHPVNIDYNLQNTYSKIYSRKLEKLMEFQLFLSFTGNKGDIEVNKEISYLKIKENDNSYHFSTDNLRGVYLHLRHVETLTNPFFLYKLSEFFIDYYINKINKISFNVLWYFQHLSSQIQSVQTKKNNSTIGFFDNLDEFLVFLSQKPNFKDFKINEKTCSIVKNIKFEISQENCTIFEVFDHNIESIWIKTNSDLEKFRVFLYSFDANKNIKKLITVTPEFNFNFSPLLPFKAIFHLNYNMLHQKNNKIIIIKSIHEKNSYTILPSFYPQNIKKVTFSDILLKKPIVFEKISKISYLIDFDLPFFMDPVFLKTSIKINNNTSEKEDILIFIWKIKENFMNSSNITTLNEIQLTNISSNSTGITAIHQEIYNIKFKFLEIIFPEALLHSAQIEIIFDFSFFEFGHYLGRNTKIEILSMLIPLSLIICSLQIADVLKNQKQESYLYKIYKHFFLIIFLWGNWNIFYYKHFTQKIVEFIGFYNGETLEKYKFWTMIFLCPSATLIILSILNCIFSFIFKIFEGLLFIIPNAIKRGIIIKILIFLQIIFMAYCLNSNIKWLLAPIILLINLVILILMRKNSKEFPYELSKTLCFIGLLFYLYNINKILLIYESSLRNDDFLQGFINEDNDLIKFFSFEIWFIVSLSLENISIRNKIFYLYHYVWFITIVTFALGQGRIYLVNFFMAYLSPGLLILTLIICYCF